VADPSADASGPLFASGRRLLGLSAVRATEPQFGRTCDCQEA